MTDSFSSSGEAGQATAGHASVIAVTAGGFFAASAALSELARPGRLDQTWRGELSGGPAAWLRLGSSLQAAKRASAFGDAGDWYGPMWAGMFARLFPWVGGADDWRRASARVEARADLGPVGLQADGSLAYEAGAAAPAGRRHDARLGYGLAVPVSVRPGGGPELGLEARYRGSITLSTSVGDSQGFDVDLAHLRAVLAHHGWMLSWAPVADVVAPTALAGTVERLDTANDFPLLAASWAPSLGLAVSRGVGSRLLDLVVPAFLELELARSARLAGEAADGRTSLTAALRLSALNLFGRLGSHPVLRCYDTDELSASARASLEFAAGETAPRALELTLSHLATFLAGKSTELSVANKLRVELGEQDRAANDAEARLEWIGASGLPVPRLLAAEGWREKVRKSTGTLRHLERIGLGVQAPAGAPGTSISATFRHETALVYPDIGSARAYAGLGLEVVHESGGWSPGLGVEAGLEVTLRF